MLLVICFHLLMAIGLCPQAALAAGFASEKPGSEGDGNFIVGPGYTIDRDLTDLGNPKGKYFEFSLRLAERKIFRGDDTTLEPAKKEVRTERKIFVLKAKGYHHRYVFSKATGHCDKRVFELTLADTLVWVWRGYKAE